MRTALGQRPMVAVVVVRRMRDDQVGQDLGNQRLQPADQRGIGNQRSVGKVEKMRRHSEPGRGLRRLPAAACAQAPPDRRCRRGSRRWRSRIRAPRPRRPRRRARRTCRFRCRRDARRSPAPSSCPSPEAQHRDEWHPARAPCLCELFMGRRRHQGARRPIVGLRDRLLLDALCRACSCCSPSRKASAGGTSGRWSAPSPCRRGHCPAIAAGVLGIYAFTTIPLAEAYSLIFLSPLFVTILSILVLEGKGRAVALVGGRRPASPASCSWFSRAFATSSSAIWRPP